VPEPNEIRAAGRPTVLQVPQAIWPLSDRGLAARLVDLATLRFLEGEQPHARQAFFADVHSIDELAPEGAVLARELANDNGDRQRLFVGDDWSLHLVLSTRRPEVQVMVTASTAELADAIIASVRRAVPPAQATDDKARLTMWTVGTGGSPNRHHRWVDTPPWGSMPLGHVPITNLIIIIVGLPVIAAAAGWLLAGRQPPGLAQQPLE
jgi:hypothetical protein